MNWKDYASLSPLTVAFGVLLAPGCPATVPPPVPATRLAYDVESELAAHGCPTDGGLAALEDRHAKPDSGLDCLFAAGGSVSKCGCP